MSYFKHVEFHKYDLTDKGISQACYDELVAELGDAWVHLTEEELRVLLKSYLKSKIQKTI